MKRWQSILLGAGITVITLYYALHNVSWDTLGDVLAHGRYIYLVIAILLTFVALLVRAFRWRSLLNQRIKMVHSFHILTASYLFYNILPFRLGEVVRVYLPTRLDPPVSAFTTLSSILVERFLDVLSVVLLVILAIAIAPVAPEVVAGARITGLIAVVGIVMLMVFAVRRDWAHRFLALGMRIVPALKRFNLVDLLDRILDGITSLGSVRGVLAAVGWTALSWLTSLAISYVLMFIFFDQPKLNAAMLALAIGSLSLAVPAAPGNVGPFEAAIVFGLTASGFIQASNPQQQTQALAYAVISHLNGVGVALILGMYGLWQEDISLGALFRSARQMAFGSQQAPASSSVEG